MARRLLLVGSENPTDIFNELAKLREEHRAPTPPQRRKRSTETFARIPHDRALELWRYRISGAAWIVLIELDRLILRSRGRNPVELTSNRLYAVGVNGRIRLRALRQLEAARVISVERRGRGRSPRVIHLWYPRQD